MFYIAFKYNKAGRKLERRENNATERGMEFDGLEKAEDSDSGMGESGNSDPDTLQTEYMNEYKEKRRAQGRQGRIRAKLAESPTRMRDVVGEDCQDLFFKPQTRQSKTTRPWQNFTERSPKYKTVSRNKYINTKFIDILKTRKGKPKSAASEEGE